MHIPDGYLGPATYGGLWATMVPIWSLAARKVRQRVRTAEVPTLAMGTVFSLVAMMFVLPLPGGTTGHITGTPLVAILLGPWAATVSVSIALAIQALLLGDGGVTALAANCFNIAFVGSVIGAAAYKLIVWAALQFRKGLGSEASGRSQVPRSLRAPAGALAAYFAVNAAALLAALELGIQPLIYSDSLGASYFPFPLKVALPAIILPHLTAVGALEAAVTGMVLVALSKKEVSMARIGKAVLILVAAMAALVWSHPALAHSVQYQVQQQTGIAVRAYYSAEDPVSYCEYELFGPGDKEPHQTGKTDRNGYLGFVPDRPGTWTLTVFGESTHGFHGVTTEIVVDQTMALESFSKPLVATYTKLITGASVAFGLFGLYALWTSRRKTIGEVK